MDFNHPDNRNGEGFSKVISHTDTIAARCSNVTMLDNLEDVIHHVNVAPFSDDYKPTKIL